MNINIEISDEEIELMIKNAVQVTVNDWVKESLSYSSSFRKIFEKDFKEEVKQMLYEPKMKNEIIDKAVKEAAFEMTRKGLPKLLETMKS